MKLSQRPFLLYLITITIITLFSFLLFNVILYEAPVQTSGPFGSGNLVGSLFTALSIVTYIYYMIIALVTYLIYSSKVKSSYELCKKFLKISTLYILIFIIILVIPTFGASLALLLIPLINFIIMSIIITISGMQSIEK